MSSFNCNRCNAPNASNARFCTNCGASMMQTQESPYQSPSANTQGALVAEYAFAGFWKRLIAYIVDGILFLVMFGIAVSLLGGSILSIGNSPEAAFAAAGFCLLYYLAWWLYFAIMESSNSQATLGKMLMGIKVTDKFGQPLSFGHATGRHFSALVTQFTLTIGYIMAGLTARKQALHDMIAGTLVVNKRYDANQVKTASENPGSGASVLGVIVIVFFVLLIPVGGIIAAIAIPAYHDYSMRVRINQAISQTSAIQNNIEEYAVNSGYWPNNLEQAGIQKNQSNTPDYQLLLATEGSYFIVFKQPEELAQGRVKFVPQLANDGSYTWSCSGQDIRPSQLPKTCREDQN
jgi:uncharacterized RDD family membrane protein YckC/Tfp pilus assembly protein PilE